MNYSYGIKAEIADCYYVMSYLSHRGKYIINIGWSRDYRSTLYFPRLDGDYVFLYHECPKEDESLSSEEQCRIYSEIGEEWHQRKNYDPFKAYPVHEWPQVIPDILPHLPDIIMNIQNLHSHTK